MRVGQNETALVIGGGIVGLACALQLQRLGLRTTLLEAKAQPAAASYGNAGHPAPLLTRASDGSLAALDAVAGYPLGIDDAETFKEATAQLEPGDTLLLYTDGITESRETLDDLFGVERLSDIMRGARDGPAILIERVRAAVRAHRHGNAAPADQTLVAALVL